MGNYDPWRDFKIVRTRWSSRRKPIILGFWALQKQIAVSTLKNTNQASELDGFLSAEFQAQELKSCWIVIIFIRCTTEKRHDDDDADGRLNLHWLWIFGENKVDDGWGGGEGCIEKNPMAASEMRHNILK